MLNPLCANMNVLFAQAEALAQVRIHRQGALLAMESPVSPAWANYAWGPPTGENIATLKALAGRRSYMWVVEGPSPAQQQSLEDAGLTHEFTFPEMALDLQRDFAVDENQQITTSDRPDAVWNETAAAGFGMNAADLKGWTDGFYPETLRQTATHSRFFLAHADATPAATAMTVRHGETVGIYCVATREAHRRRGLGLATMHAALREAKYAGARRAYLYSTPGAVAFYAGMGFSTVAQYNAYFWQPPQLL